MDVLECRGVAFFFNDTAATEIYTLSLHDALPIYSRCSSLSRSRPSRRGCAQYTPRTSRPRLPATTPGPAPVRLARSEEHTSELQSRQYLVCRLLLEKKPEVTPAPRFRHFPCRGFR